MKVLVVDDSVVYRTAIKTALSSANKDYEIDVAANGKIAVEKIKANTYEIVTLDLEMPVMDGIETIKEIRTFDKDLPIIIFSAQNMQAANKTLMALELGANDFVKKIEGSSDINENLQMINNELIPRFKALTERTARMKAMRGGATTTEAKAPVSSSKPFKERSFLELQGFRPDIICLASSTGGPDALKKVFSNLKALRTPLVMVQHMPPVFTTQLAKALDEVSPMTVVEAKPGDELKPNHAYLAPGDYHMFIEKKDDKYQLNLNQGPKVCYVRPAADVLFESVAKNFPDKKVLAIVLTGMGNDGAHGCEVLQKLNTRVIIQDEDSSVVWGMPKAVYDIGCQDIRLNISKIPELINKMAAG